jgi:hypothetical protein
MQQKWGEVTVGGRGRVEHKEGQGGMSYVFFASVFHFFTTIDFLHSFFTIKVAESIKIVLVSCIIDFKDIKA